MTDMNEDLEAVRIRHLGQCMNHKGHDSFSWIVPLLLGVIAGFWITVIVVSFSPSSGREKEAIQRGYATRDPITSEFKWR